MDEKRSGLSRSVEDYLKAIYSLSEGDGAVSTSAIADALQVQPASVTGMIKRLAEAGYLEHIPYRGVELTAHGSREALRILRRHRILETYLTERLGYPWEDVHREAERLEHAASDELIERMAAALKDPSHDPHGAPIPTPAGEIEVTESCTLAELSPGDFGQVRAVRDDDSEGLLTAEAAGLIPGARLRVISRTLSPPGLSLELEGGETGPLQLEMEIAGRIYMILEDPGGAGEEEGWDRR
jgi:DtxR family Mn-dependent transcriptional regulator